MKGRSEVRVEVHVPVVYEELVERGLADRVRIEELARVWRRILGNIGAARESDEG